MSDNEDVSYSRLHSKCEKCSYKNECNNKRMVACLSMVDNNVSNQISVGEYLEHSKEISLASQKCGISTEELQKSIQECYKNLHSCNFNSGRF